MKEIIFATNNAHKLEEARAITAGRFRVLSLQDVGCHEELPETSDTLEGNALQKARYVHEHYGTACFADDTGLMVDALGGAPGVYTARYAGDHCSSDDNMAKLLAELEGKEQRTARFATYVAYVTDEGEHVFRGVAEGSIARQREGEGGFGYDPVFVSAETGRSFASMSAEEKNAISHRGRAMRSFMDFLLKDDGNPEKASLHP